MNTPQTFIFAGPSGSGKGTQVEKLKEYLLKNSPEIPQFHSYTGDGFRAFMKGETLASRLARDIQNAGKLQPEFLAVYLWADNFIKNIKGGEHIFIDGSPRKPAEAVVLHSALKFFDRSSIHLIVVNISPEEAKRRLLLRARHDDSDNEIARRLGWYETEVVPSIEYMRSQPDFIVHDINGEQTPEKVFEDILKAVL